MSFLLRKSFFVYGFFNYINIFFYNFYWIKAVFFIVTIANNNVFLEFFQILSLLIKNNLHFVHFSKSYFYLINDFWSKKCVIIAKKTQWKTAMKNWQCLNSNRQRGDWKIYSGKRLRKMSRKLAENCWIHFPSFFRFCLKCHFSLFEKMPTDIIFDVCCFFIFFCTFTFLDDW